MDNNNRPDIKKKTKDWLNKYGRYILLGIFVLSVVGVIVCALTFGSSAMPSGSVVDEPISFTSGIYLPQSLRYTFTDFDDDTESNAYIAFDDVYNVSPLTAIVEGETDQIRVGVETRLNNIYDAENNLIYENAHVTIIDGLDGSFNSGYWGAYSPYVVKYRDFYVVEGMTNPLGVIVDANASYATLSPRFTAIFRYYGADGTELGSTNYNHEYTDTPTNIAGRTAVLNLDFEPWRYAPTDTAYVLVSGLNFEVDVSPDSIESLTLIQYDAVPRIVPVFEKTEYIELQPVYTDFSLVGVITDAINNLFDVEWLGGITLGSFFGLVIAIPVMFFVFKTFLGG